MTLTMSYEGLVEAGRAAREQADNMQWVEGDLALQVETLPGDERPRDPETGAFIVDEAKALQRYAADVDVKYTTLREYRRIAEAWPSPTRVGEASWRVHYALAAQEDRFDLIRPGMTVREAETLIRARTAGARGKPGWHELLGRVGDDLIAADKHLKVALDAIESPDRRSDPDARIFAKAERYASMADVIAQRLRGIA